MNIELSTGRIFKLPEREGNGKLWKVRIGQKLSEPSVGLWSATILNYGGFEGGSVLVSEEGFVVFPQHHGDEHLARMLEEESRGLEWTGAMNQNSQRSEYES